MLRRPPSSFLQEVRAENCIIDGVSYLGGSSWQFMRLNWIKLVVPAISLGLLLCQASAAQEYPSQEQHNWVESRFNGVLEEFLPIEEFELGYRSYRDLHTDVLEYSFGFNRNWNEKRIYVVMRMADSVSLYDQMMLIHRKNSSDTLEVIKKKLKVKEWRLDDKSCPAVKSSYDEFFRQSLLMMTASDRASQGKDTVTITLHPTVHILKAWISGGNMRLALTEREHPFVLWATRARRAFEKCMRKMK